MSCPTLHAHGTLSGIYVKPAVSAATAPSVSTGELTCCWIGRVFGYADTSLLENASACAQDC